MGTDEREHQSSIHTVVLEDSLRKRRAVGGTPADHSMDADYTGYIGVACVHPTDVRSTRGFVTDRVVILKDEGIVASRVCPKLGIIVQRAHGQGRATAPASHHF